MEQAGGRETSPAGQLFRTEAVWKVLPGAQRLPHSRAPSQVAELARAPRPSLAARAASFTTFTLARERSLHLAVAVKNVLGFLLKNKGMKGSALERVQEVLTQVGRGTGRDGPAGGQLTWGPHGGRGRLSSPHSGLRELSGRGVGDFRQILAIDSLLYFITYYRGILTAFRRLGGPFREPGNSVSPWQLLRLGQAT